MVHAFAKQARHPYYGKEATQPATTLPAVGPVTIMSKVVVARRWLIGWLRLPWMGSLGGGNP